MYPFKEKKDEMKKKKVVVSMVTKQGLGLA